MDEIIEKLDRLLAAHKKGNRAGWKFKNIDDYLTEGEVKLCALAASLMYSDEIDERAYFQIGYQDAFRGRSV